MFGGAKVQGILEFVKQHFDTIITVSITIIGFIVTYFMNKKSVQDERQGDAHYRAYGNASVRCVSIYE